MATKAIPAACQRRVAVVTGGNKGIGLAIVSALCREFDGDVILTARDPKRGESACASLAEQGLAARFHQLDITDDVSIAQITAFLRASYDGLDILVNNAGIAFQMGSDADLAEKARVTMETNFFGTRKVCVALFPLLRPSGRVVNVASALGRLNRIKNEDMRSGQLSSPDLSEDDLVALANSYITAEASGDHGLWPKDLAYGMSKLFLIGLNRIQARDMEKRRPGANILVNSCCPGFVKTDLNSHKGHLTTEQGAQTPVFLALLPDGSPSGQFYKQKAVCKW